IDGSQWLRNPELEVVQTNKGPGSSFTLTADQVTMAGPDDKAAGSRGKMRKASIAGTGARQ
ncbi:MAG: hypothetical protein JO203_11915, partial [Gammaproteobacteria bacterium]|nr:hypothetical protein [Gammaproteobacteria bacterium]